MFVKLTNPAIVCIALCHDNPGRHARAKEHDGKDRDHHFFS